ncbi:MAG: hypothetical protein IPO24_20085 [Bacteroidetes bacterium]|nr:hypothetical protein [Bacteroidota bacterium]
MKNNQTQTIQPVEKTKRLQMLMSSKNLLVKQRAALLCSTKEYQNIGLSDKDLILKAQLVVIKELTKQIDLLKQKLILIIKPIYPLITATNY